MGSVLIHDGGVLVGPRNHFCQGQVCHVAPNFMSAHVYEGSTNLEKQPMSMQTDLKFFWALSFTVVLNKKKQAKKHIMDSRNGASHPVI